MREFLGMRACVCVSACVCVCVCVGVYECSLLLIVKESDIRSFLFLSRRGEGVKGGACASR